MPGKPSIGRALKEAGYTTAHVGKWHVSGPAGYPAPIHVGFDFSFDERNQYNDPEIYDPNDPKQANFFGLFAQPKDRLKDAFNDPRFPLLEDDRPYDSMTDLSQRWIRNVAAKDQPFFLNLCPSLVHGPIMTRDRKRLEHYCQKLGIPFPTDPGPISDPKTPGQDNPYYASMVDSVDWIVGQILRTLEETDDARNPGHKLIDNTYVFVSSDNGAAQALRDWGHKEREKVGDNAPLREGKAYVYEGGIRIPFIVFGPGVPEGSVNRETPVNLIDFFPTFLAISGNPADEALDLDGCDLLPVLQGREQVVRHRDGAPRDTVFFHHPVVDHAFSVVVKGDWKLMLNISEHLNPAPRVQLFNLREDIGETENLVDKYPEKAAAMESELREWLTAFDAGMPYNNAASDLPGRDRVPGITGLGSGQDRIWATFETEDKAAVSDAYLLYTVNGSEALRRHPSHEEWYRAPAGLTPGRVEAKAVPGMTHAVFCLIDENNFLIYSEPLPSVRDYHNSEPIVPLLKDGYAYKPGLAALIKHAESAMRSGETAGLDTRELAAGIAEARRVVQQPVDEVLYSQIMRDLALQIRALPNIPEANLDALIFMQQQTIR